MSNRAPDLRIARWQVGTGGFMSHITIALPSGPVLEVARKVDLEIVELYVHPLRRGQGWASLLMHKACTYSTRQGATMGLRAQPEGYGCPRDALAYGALKQFYGGFGFRTVVIKDPTKLTYDIPLDCIMVRK